MRLGWLSLVLLGLLACGGGPSGNPSDFKGTFDVTVSANGHMDADVVNINVGANGTILLDFLYGVSKSLRCSVTGPTSFGIVSQRVSVDHSTGSYDGLASGMGTIDKTGTLKMELDVAYGAMFDGGTAPPPDVDGGMGVVTFDIEGMRRM